MSAKGITPPGASTVRRTPTAEDYKRGWYYRTEADELNRAIGYDGGIRTCCRDFTSRSIDFKGKKKYSIPEAPRLPILGASSVIGRPLAKDDFEEDPYEGLTTLEKLAQIKKDCQP